MSWLIANWRFIAVAALAAASFVAGFATNGWRWDAKHQALITAHAQARLDAEHAAREKERTYQATADKERTIRDEKIRALNATLNTTLEQLRQRTSRPANAEAAANPAASATGQQLYREDAEFLIREAARADAVMAEWQACYATYEAVRQGSK